MDRYRLEIVGVSDHAILINWPQKVDDKILEDVIRYSKAVREHYGSRLENYTPAYASLMLIFKEKVDLQVEEKKLLDLYNQENEWIINPRHWEIPVCYHSDLGPDQKIFVDNGMMVDELIEAHTSPKYRVFMIGFLPGFLYLGGLSDSLYMPRKDKPNLRTPAGAVAIGGQQTGIYPIQSPGGWHVIGRTPLKIFDINREAPTPINQGDYVKFYPIDLEIYHALRFEN